MRSRNWTGLKLLGVALLAVGISYIGLVPADGQNPFPAGAASWGVPVPLTSSLPTTGNFDGSARVALDTHRQWTWNATATAWQPSAQLSDAFGGSHVPFALPELLALSTSGVTTTGTHNLLPAGSILESVDCVVKVTITGSGVTGWEVGDGTTVDRFISTVSALTAGTSARGWNIRQPAYATTNAKGPIQPTLAQVVVTAVGGTPTAGQIHCSSYGVLVTPPTS